MQASPKSYEQDTSVQVSSRLSSFSSHAGKQIGATSLPAMLPNASDPTGLHDMGDHWDEQEGDAHSARSKRYRITSASTDRGRLPSPLSDQGQYMQQQGYFVAPQMDEWHGSEDGHRHDPYAHHALNAPPQFPAASMQHQQHGHYGNLGDRKAKLKHNIHNML